MALIVIPFNLIEIKTREQKITAAILMDRIIVVTLLISITMSISIFFHEGRGECLPKYTSDTFPRHASVAPPPVN